MRQTPCLLLNFLNNEDGAAAIETGLVTSLVGVASVAALTDVGHQLAALFSYIASVIATALATAGGR